MTKPLLAITMGDPAGVGPETIVGAWRNAALHDSCNAVVVGHPVVIRRAASLWDSSADVVEVGSPDEVLSDVTTIPCLPCGSAVATEVEPAIVDPRGGRAAYDALMLAAELALAGRVDGIVTAPLNKTALWQAGLHYPGHTELLAELCGVTDVAMMLYLSPGPAVRGRVGLSVVHVTLHMALRDVFQHLNIEAIVAKSHLADSVVRSFLRVAGNGAQPRIGVCALNPHGGESGLFGDEEQQLILPAVERAAADGLAIDGPLPCDTLLMRAAEGEFDAVVAMYHDQGHIALKLLGMHRAVNVTLGLPIVRTSVAHGTAFDLAWQGRAETSGMVEAVRVAAQLVLDRKRTRVEIG